MVEHQSHYLLVNGMLLFILGLLNALVIPLFKNKRLGFAAHLADVQSDMVLPWRYCTTGSLKSSE